MKTACCFLMLFALVSGMHAQHSERFRGHWAGIEWGLNNLADEGFSIAREDGLQYMDLNTARSWVVNLNFAQYSLGLGTSYVGLVTGMGFEFNNYFFDNELVIEEINDQIQPVDLSGQGLVKSKLVTTYLRVPLLLEFQFPGGFRSNRAFLAAGVVGSLRLGAHTKAVFKVDDEKEKVKNRDDFNTNGLRYGFTARLGYGNTNIFIDYYPVSLFVQDKGPELYPFSVGLAATF